MNEYHKINSIFKRTPDGRKVLWGEYSDPAFEYLADNLWVFTEKVDGTNIRVIWNEERLTFGGKTERAQIPAKLVARLEERFLPQVDTYFKPTFGADSACLYGEGYGPGIQGGGKYRSDGPDFVLFDVKVGQWWLERNNVGDVAAKLDLMVVPEIGQGSLSKMVKRVGDGFVSTWATSEAFSAEGIVARPASELRTRQGHRIITKLKHRDFK